MAGLAAVAAETLRSDRIRFKPALAMNETAGWSLRDALVHACGCDRRAGPLAYWEWQELHGALQAVRRVIVEHAGLPKDADVERWANEPTRTADDVLKALDAVPAPEDVPVPEPPSLRPWCDPKTIATCRIPYIPLAALVHAWGERERPWSNVANEHGLRRDTTAWQFLGQVDPVIKDTSPPDGVAEIAWKLREWMDLSEAHGVVRWLFTILDADPTTDLRTLHEMAARAVGAHEDT